MDTTEQFHVHVSLSSTGEGNGNPLWCSCLENPRDRGAWWAAVYGVTQSRTRLKRLSSSSSRRNIGILYTKIIAVHPSSHSKFYSCECPMSLQANQQKESHFLAFYTLLFSSASALRITNYRVGIIGLATLRGQKDNLRTGSYNLTTTESKGPSIHRYFVSLRSK